MKTKIMSSLAMSILILWCGMASAADAPAMDAELREKARRAVDGGLHYLRLMDGDISASRPFSTGSNAMWLPGLVDLVVNQRGGGNFRF